MNLSNLDIISPKLTLYYKNKESHSSSLGGVITIIAYTIILAATIYFSLDIFLHNNPTAFYFNKFVEDAGIFPLNSSSMFHFFQMSLVNNEVDIVDFNAISIIGVQELINTYTENNDLTRYDHWIYGNCDSNKDLNDLEYLNTFSNFENSGCIRKFYNHTTKTYYETSEKGFIYPTIEKGCSHPNRTFYGIIIERCRNSSLRATPCKSDQEIDQYIATHVGLEMEIIDQYVDVTHYKSPYTKYFYKITNGLFRESFATNHLNFNPSTITTHNGLLFDNKEEKVAYVFEQNEKITQETMGTGIYCAFYFWMQNRMQIYERSYKRLQDVAASAGGIASLLTVLASFLNFFYNKFIIYLDFLELTKECSININHRNSYNLEKTQMSQNCVSTNIIYTASSHKRGSNLKSSNIQGVKKIFRKQTPISIPKTNFFKFFIDFLLVPRKKKNYIIHMVDIFRRKICSEEQMINYCLEIYTLKKAKDKIEFDGFEIKELLS